jgi:quinol monooxygenase YgiN
VISRNLCSALKAEASTTLRASGDRLEETTMMAIGRQPAALRGIVARCLLVRCAPAFAFAMALAAVAAPSAVRAQSGSDAIYGVTALEVAPSAASQGVALLQHYRDGALSQPGNMGVTLLQEVGWPNRFMVYEGWKDQSAYDANEQSVHSSELRDKLKSMAAAPYDRRAYHVIAVGPAQEPAGLDAVYMQLHLDVFPAGIEKTLAAARAVADAARKDEGNLRYDVVRSVKPPQSHTTFLAVWRDRKAFDAYESSAYTRQFRDAVGPLLGSPFDDRLYVPIN